MKKSLTKLIAVPQCSFARVVPVSVPPLAAVLSDVKSAFFGLCVQAGKEVLGATMKADRVQLCGPKGRPDAQRQALRGGHTQSWVTLGRRRVKIHIRMTAFGRKQTVAADSYAVREFAIARRQRRSGDAACVAPAPRRSRSSRRYPPASAVACRRRTGRPLQQLLRRRRNRELPSRRDSNNWRERRRSTISVVGG